MKFNKRLILVLIILIFTLLFPNLSKELNIPSKDVLSEIEVVKPSPTVFLPQNGQVTKVIDGDTIEVYLNNKKEKIRVIGINTPETVDPRRTVECFGKEASERAKSLLLNKIVSLESDPSQSDKDRYGRLLRYVYLPDKTDFGLIMIKEGYAYEYTYDTPYKYQVSYKNAQQLAEKEGLGLWNVNFCNQKE